MDDKIEKRYLSEQLQVDLYYANKKKEVAHWIIDYEKDLKRITQEQRKRIEAYARAVSFTNIGELNVYVQNLKTVGKKEKQRLRAYLGSIEWLPEGINSGIIDGQIVNRILPNELDLLLDALREKE